MKKLNTQQFIERARLVHGDSYDYFQCTYVNTDLVTDIICKTHGRFSQAAYNHLAGKGCRLCANSQRPPRFTTEQFIERARLVHGDRYDYSASIYVNSKLPMTIICVEHGPFKQAASNHLAGKHCRHCAGNQHPSNEAILARFQAIYGDKYTYDPSTFTNCHGTIGATCKLHGPFQVSFTYHLKGVGCQECSGRYRHKAGEHFVGRATKLHDGKYDYSLALYVSAMKPVQILCPVHGSFFQGPGSHLQGHGCPQCGDEKKGLNSFGCYCDELFDNFPEIATQAGMLYLVKFSNLEESFLKVGITVANVKVRFKSGYSNYDIEILRTLPMMLGPAFHMEQGVLYAFKDCKYVPKQRIFPGKMECLNVDCEEMMLDFWPSVEDLYEEAYGR